MSGYDDIKKMWLTHELIMRKLKNYGDIYFVDGTNGDDDYKGEDPGSPMKTLEEAIDRATDWGNDVIIHKGGASIASGTITVDKNKLSILGWGLFGANPYFPETGVISRLVAEDLPVLTIDADFVEIAGKTFAAEWVTDDVEGQSALLVGDGSNKAYIHNCFFPDWNIASQTVGLGITGGHYTVIEDCEFQSTWDNMDAGIYIKSAVGQPAYTRIRRCNFMGQGLGGTAMTTGIDMSQPAHQQWMIENCNFLNVTNAVKFGAAADLWGIIRDCVGSMAVSAFCTGGSGCDTIANAKTNYEVILANIWGSGNPLTA